MYPSILRGQGVPGVPKTDPTKGESMEKESGGVSSALTKDEFEAIKQTRDDWRRQKMAGQIYMASVDDLIAEIERVHPEWVEPRWRVTCVAGSRTVESEGLTLEDATDHLKGNTHVRSNWRHTFELMR